MNILKSRSINSQSNFDKASIHTSLGDIEIDLLCNQSPMTVLNFIRYIKIGQYKETIFHRVMKKFMIQGGEYFFDGTSRKPVFEPINSEAYNLVKNERGTVAMARNNNINSAKCQFFINTRNNTNLNKKYTVFAKVTKGMDIVDKIEKLETQKGGWPKAPAVIKNISLIK